MDLLFQPLFNLGEWVYFFNLVPIRSLQFRQYREGETVSVQVVYSTVQYSTVQYSTVQYSTIQYSTVQYSTVQYSPLTSDGGPGIPRWESFTIITLININ